MLKEVTMYTIICDNCKENFNQYQELRYWDDKDYVEEISIERDWIKEKDKHYCPDCVDFDENDNLILKVIKEDRGISENNNIERISLHGLHLITEREYQNTKPNYIVVDDPLEEKETTKEEIKRREQYYDKLIEKVSEIKSTIAYGGRYKI